MLSGSLYWAFISFWRNLLLFRSWQKSNCSDNGDVESYSLRPKKIKWRHWLASSKRTCVKSLTLACSMFHVVSAMQMEGSLEVTFLAFVTFHSSHLEHIEWTTFKSQMVPEDNSSLLSLRAPLLVRFLSPACFFFPAPSLSWYEIGLYCGWSFLTISWQSSCCAVLLAAAVSPPSLLSSSLMAQCCFLRYQLASTPTLQYLTTCMPKFREEEQVISLQFIGSQQRISKRRRKKRKQVDDGTAIV